MIPPTASEVRGWSKVGFGELGYPADDGAGGLGVLVTRATSTLRKITGLDLTTMADDDADVALVQQAIQGLTEQLAYDQQPERVETLADWDLISAFSAGPYSETRRSPEDMRKARLLNPWPWLSALLWDLLTDDRYDYWVAFFSGVPTPAWGVQEVEWDHNAVGYGDAYPYFNE